MPSLQVSVPGQRTTSTMVPAPACSQAAARSACIERGQSASLTQRSTMFCSTVVRRVSLTYLAGDVGQRAQLVGGDVAQRQRHRDGA